MGKLAKSDSNGWVSVWYDVILCILILHTGVKGFRKSRILCKNWTLSSFLNVHHQLERQGADIQTKVEEVEQLSQSVRDHDKMKDDAIAQLSDQLVTITTRLQELERSSLQDSIKHY